eukprot:g5140.t1
MRTLLDQTRTQLAGPQGPSDEVYEVYEVYDGPLGEFFKKFEMSEMPTAGYVRSSPIDQYVDTGAAGSFRLH